MKKNHVFCFVVICVCISIGCNASNNKEILSALNSKSIFQGADVDQLPLVIPASVYFSGEHVCFFYGNEKDGVIGVYSYKDKVHSAFWRGGSKGEFSYFFFDKSLMSDVLGMKLKRM